MLKRILAAALVVGGIVAIPAQATPVLWEINPSGTVTPTGSFYYDPATGSYSGIDVWGAFLTHYANASSSSTDTTLDMWTYGSSNLVLTFSDSLSSGLMQVAFTSSESAWWGFLTTSGRGVVNDPPAPASVPEPGTLMLLGAGLAALGLMRRRKPA
jgi:hypothetical protein